MRSAPGRGHTGAALAMTLEAASIAELASVVAAHHARGAKLPPVSLRAVRGVLAHTPEDMTVKVEAGIVLADLQARLAARGQWLPLDPPKPARVTVREIIEQDLNGPRRCGYGTIREHVIGLTALLPDGRLIHSGGNVVKNVAGYDLQKLFIGSRGTLGIVVEAVFKVSPIAESWRLVDVRLDSFDRAAASLASVQASPLTPVVLDLHNLSHATEPRTSVHVVLGFAGTREDVEWQVAQARGLGIWNPSDLTHEERFWAADGLPRKWSVLPSRLCETAAQLGGAPFIARAANGVLFTRGGPMPPKPALPDALMRRAKEAFDPKRILPDLDL